MAARENHCWPTAHRLVTILATEPAAALESNRALARRVGRDERTVERALATMEKAGMLARFYSRPAHLGDTGRVLRLTGREATK